MLGVAVNAISNADEMFNDFDLNKDDLITAEEMSQVLGDKFNLKLSADEVSNVMKSIDADDDGKINKSEFVVLLKIADADRDDKISGDELSAAVKVIAAESKPIADYMKIFKAFDGNNDGKMDYKEMSKMVKKGFRMKKATPTQLKKLFQAADTHKDDVIDAAEFTEFLSKIDTNKDGQIRVPEIRAYLATL